MSQIFSEFVNEFSFCCHSTIKKILWNNFYLMGTNSEKNPTIFDLTFDTHDNHGDIYKIYKWFWIFFIPHLLVWTDAKNTSKTQHFLLCFCCVLHPKTPRFFKWGGYLYHNFEHFLTSLNNWKNLLFAQFPLNRKVLQSLEADFMFLYVVPFWRYLMEIKICRK